MNRMLAVVVLGATVCASRTIQAAENEEAKRQCIAASERAQVLRNESKLKEEGGELRACSRPACPPVIRQDCSQWVGEVLEQLPSVVIGARDGEGHDVVAARVSIDGVVVAERLDGRPV